jgi:hypothetical protein
MSQITFADISVEARTEVILEAAEESAWAIESTDKKIERLKELLTQQKAALGYGKWLPWVRETFGDSDAAIWKVQRWMRGRSNNAPAHYLDLPENGTEQPIVPRAERKTGRVEVQEAGQTVVQADHSVDVSKMVDENAVKAEPKTNTKHTPATTKAKEADRPAPMTITPVIIEEPPTVPDEPSLADWSVVELLTFLKSSADDPKKRARELRKAADELDPPTKFVKPTVEDVAEYCQQRKNNIDAEMFVAHYAANGWKLANGNKLNDWKSAVITWEKRNDSGSQQSGRAIAGTGRIKPGKIDESQIEWR